MLCGWTQNMIRNTRVFPPLTDNHSGSNLLLSRSTNLQLLNDSAHVNCHMHCGIDGIYVRPVL